VSTPGASLEERKFLQESEQKSRELALKEREVVARETELRRARWLNPVFLGLVGATVGLFGNLVVAFIGNRNTQQIEHSRAQSSLIVQAVSTGDAKAACKNLLSFIRLGLLDDPKGTISQCETGLGTIPVLPSVRTYTPATEASDSPLALEMAPVVTSIDSGNDLRFEVTFTVPRVSPEAPFKPPFDLIIIYAYQIDERNARSAETRLPDVSGNWKPGDRATISANLPKKYVNDPVRKSYLRLCVGVRAGCVPSANLLLPNAR